MIWDTEKRELFYKWKAWWIERHPPEIGEYSWSFLFERGKQIRAHMFCELWNYLAPETPVCVEIAFIIECVHVLSLILDDLPWMDNATERRGWQTLHSKFSIRKAILIAYDVLELAYAVSQSQSILQNKYAQSINWNEWIQTKVQILWCGQWLDLSRTGTLDDLARMKTAILFECVTELVAIFLDLDLNFWREFGKHIGILFQWIDDWNDRDEDIIIQQRNAFNESYEWTLSEYTHRWKKIVQSIGKSWWQRPFGKYLWKYFTVIYSDPLIIPEITSVHNLMYLFGNDSPQFNLSNFISKYNNSSTNNGLSFMLFFIPYFTNTSLPINLVENHMELSLSELWSKDESEWIVWLGKKKEMTPFLVTIRKLEKIIQSVTN